MDYLVLHADGQSEVMTVAEMTLKAKSLPVEFMSA